jgi:chondroitin AC lyase
MLRLICVLLIPTWLPAQTSDLALIRERVVAQLLDEPVDGGRIENLLAELTPDGYWPDLDYVDTSRTGFAHSRHLDRLVLMAQAYAKPGSSLQSDERLRKGLTRAIFHWTENDYLSANWWHNQIGTPWKLVHTLLMLPEADWSGQLRAAALPAIGRANLSAWGARPGGDLIKIAGILGQTALLTRDTTTLRRATDAMAREIQFATDRGTPGDVRGLQPDMSFQHRDDQVTSILSYGLGYARAFAEWADWLRGTRYQFPRERIELLVDYYLDGIGHALAFGTYPDPAAKNRSLSRPGALHPYPSLLPRQLLRVTDYRSAALRQLIACREHGTCAPPPHATFFWRTEHFTQQRPDYFTSVRMYSDRNHNMEVPYNGEGLTNHYLGDGANYLIRDGDEYPDIHPVWDWRKVPGTTVVQKQGLPPPDSIQQPGLTSFVGGVTDGELGAAVFDFVSPFDSLSAKKSWFFFADGYVCLGAGITSSEREPVVTTLDQRWLAGEVVTKASPRGEVVERALAYDDPPFVCHDSVAYLFPTGGRVFLRGAMQRGRWYDLNQQVNSSKEEVMGSVFSLWIDHGRQPRSATYAYTVLPGVDAFSAAARSVAPRYVILQNTEGVQAVTDTLTGMTQAVFYRAGSLELPGGRKLTVSAPIAILVAPAEGGAYKVTVADPGRELEEVRVELEGIGSETVVLPGGDYTGKSTSVLFRYPHGGG